MSVVGFDIGNESCVIAAAKQRGIDVLLNDESERENPAVVSFGEKQRFIGSAGAASMMMNTKSTITQIKRLIGRKFKEPDVQNELKMLPFETSESPDGGIFITVKNSGKMHNFTPVQIMGMLLAHLKQVAEKNLEVPIGECVISIPSYFTNLQRHAYLNAAEISGLKTLRLMHDSTATALSYGIYKTDFSSTGAIYVAFVDIGHCDTQVSIVMFEAGQMRILSHSFDSNLGGRDFDEVLFRHFSEVFKEQYKIDVYSNVKASIRLRMACAKLKKVLSANAEAPLNIECLMEEKDVKGIMKREEFEKLASGLLERITVPCTKALADTGLTVDKLHSVELVGSGSRIPAITRLVASVFRIEPRRTLNASECVARGCALQCAMLSPLFRVKEYEVQDSIPFSIGFMSDGGPVGTGPNGILFPRGQPVPSVKFMTLQRSSSSFDLEAFYVNPNELPTGVSQKISCFTIGPLQGFHGETAKVKVKFHLNLHGIVTIESATLIEGHVDDSATNDTAHSNTDKLDAESVSLNDSGNGMKKDKGTRRLKLPISENVYGGMTKTELKDALKKELLLAQKDRAIEQAKEKKNALESYVYETRNKLFNSYRSFTTDSEREDISKSLQKTEEWLYEDGDDETENAYSMKLDDIQKLVVPIENRYRDEEARAQATRDLLKCIVDHRMSLDSLSNKDRELISNECYKAEQWLREKSLVQDSLPKNADPVLWSSDIKSTTDDLNAICDRILSQKTSPPHRQ